MRTKAIALASAVCILLMSSAAYAAQKGEYTKDEYIFERLLRERSDVYEQYVQALQKGKEQMKEVGDVELNIKNEILDLRAKKDRVETRLVTIALRHGWDVPALTDPDLGRRVDIEARELEKVFGMANVLVKSELRKDAGVFTANLDLPAQKISLK